MIYHNIDFSKYPWLWELSCGHIETTESAKKCIHYLRQAKNLIKIEILNVYQ